MVKVLKIALVLLIFQFIYSPLLYPQTKDLQFEHVTVENGLSNNNVQCILQDKQGFMWFGTSDGLNRWDGYTVKIFTKDANDSNSISDNYITALHGDSSGLIWIGTSEGLNNYNPKTKKFTHYLLDQDNPNSISNNYVYVIFEDSTRNIWIGTGHGLNRFNRENDNFTRYFFPGQLDSVNNAWNNNIISAINESKDGKLLLGTMNDFLLFDTKTEETTIIHGMIPERKHWPLVYTIFKDRLRKLWIAIANQGIAEYDSNTGLIRFYKPEPKNPNSLGINVVPTSFCEDKSGNLWIGTANQGLYIFDRSKHFTNYKPIYNDEKKINSDAISCIYKDKKGNIWIGTEDNGINMMLKWKKPFRHYIHDPQNSNSLAAGEVSNFYEDKNGIVWITNLRGGVSLFDRTTGNFTHITHNPQNTASLSEGMLYAVCEDKYGCIWFATAPDLTYMERKAGMFKHYRHNLANPKSHAYTHTLCCYEDQQGTMWFGTANAGLERYNRADGTFDHFKHDPADSNSISDDGIFSLNQDKAGNFWIGTEDGLCQMIHDSTGKEKFICYRQHPVDPESNQGNIILATYEDRIGRFWIVTDAGLSLFDRDKKSFETIIEGEDLPSSFIWGILEDDQGITEGKAGNLWLRTLRGILKFNPETRKLQVYDERDGLKYCRSIRSGFAAFYKGKNGEIYSGGINSITVFHPDSLADNPDPPKIVLTDFKINYKTVQIGPKSPLKKSATFSDLIKLAYYQNIISFEFAALDYTAPAKNLFAYKLEGINRDWVYTDASQRDATYTNLNPGKYVFRVKGSNNDGVWNEEGVSVRIIITPPWWKTNWFRLFAGLAIILAALLLYEYRMSGLKRAKIVQEQFSQKLIELQEQERKRIAAELHDSLGQNLLIISNEIQQYLRKQKSHKKDLAGVSSIIKESIDETREIAQNLHPHQLERLGLTRATQAVIQKIAHPTVIKFESTIDDIDHILPQSLEIHFYRIIQEALNNIVKHSNATAAIVKIKKKPDHIQVIIKDNGKGFAISQDKLPHNSSLGFGISDMKERARLIKADFQISTDKGKGTTVHLSIPISDSAVFMNK